VAPPWRHFLGDRPLGHRGVNVDPVFSVRWCDSRRSIGARWLVAAVARMMLTRAHRTPGRGRSAFSQVVPLMAYGSFAIDTALHSPSLRQLLVDPQAGPYGRPKHRFERYRSELSVE